MLSPVSGTIDRSAPADVRESARDRVACVEAARIMPFILSKYSTLRSQSGTFVASNVEPILEQATMDRPSNLFCIDHDSHFSFDEFVFGVEYLRGRYWLRKLVPEQSYGFMARRQDGERSRSDKGLQVTQSICLMESCSIFIWQSAKSYVRAG
ncbi:hypothetical protein V1507DRAFT_467185 [Lipomyces tetrasporus]